MLPLNRPRGDTKRRTGVEPVWCYWIGASYWARWEPQREGLASRLIVMKTSRGPIKFEGGEAPSSGDARLALLPELDWGRGPLGRRSSCGRLSWIGAPANPRKGRPLSKSAMPGGVAKKGQVDEPLLRCQDVTEQSLSGGPIVLKCQNLEDFGGRGSTFNRCGVSRRVRSPRVIAERSRMLL